MIREREISRAWLNRAIIFASKFPRIHKHLPIIENRAIEHVHASISVVLAPSASRHL